MQGQWQLCTSLPAVAGCPMQQCHRCHLEQGHPPHHNPSSDATNPEDQPKSKPHHLEARDTPRSHSQGHLPKMMASEVTSSLGVSLQPAVIEGWGPIPPGVAHFGAAFTVSG